MADPRQIDIGPPTDASEALAFAHVAARALFFPSTDLDVWIELEGPENVRVVRRGGTVIGGLIVQRMGQWFGGRSVSTGAVRGVGVLPEYRAGGVGVRLMRATLEELHRDGVALSTLFPATLPVYRRPGYEIAGTRLAYRLSTHDIDTRERGLDLREMEEADHAVAGELYAERARRTNGNLDRNEWLWRRILTAPSWLTRTRGYLVERDGKAEGYLVMGPKAGASSAENILDVTDLVALTADAGRRLLTFLADHRSMAGGARFAGAPADPLAYLLAEEKIRIDHRDDWMLRMVNVPAALEARGYPAGVSAELHIDVSDDLLPENNGRFTVEVEGARATGHEGGRGDLRIDVRGLAPLYTGYLSPGELKATGYLDGTDDSLALAATIFAGPSPWMPDDF